MNYRQQRKTKNSFSVYSKFPKSKDKLKKEKKEVQPIKMVRFKNAILVRDSTNDNGIILYRTGEVFYGRINSQNKTFGYGIFFFPYCGFVYGKFEENKICDFGVFKEPDSTFGIGEFSEGIFENFHIHFNLNSLTANRSNLFNKKTSLKSKFRFLNLF
jgi:hypothetical protein